MCMCSVALATFSMVRFLSLARRRGVTSMQLGIRIAFVVSLVMVCSGLRSSQGQGVAHGASGTVYGKVVAAYFGGGVRNASVYLFTLNQSKRLREMDESAYRRAQASGINEDEASSIKQ